MLSIDQALGFPGRTLISIDQTKKARQTSTSIIHINLYLSKKTKTPS